MIQKIGAWGIVLWVANYPNRWKLLKRQLSGITEEGDGVKLVVEWVANHASYAFSSLSFRLGYERAIEGLQSGSKYLRKGIFLILLLQSACNTLGRNYLGFGNVTSFFTEKLYQLLNTLCGLTRSPKSKTSWRSFRKLSVSIVIYSNWIMVFYLMDTHNELSEFAYVTSQWKLLCTGRSYQSTKIGTNHQDT